MVLPVKADQRHPPHTQFSRRTSLAGAPGFGERAKSKTFSEWPLATRINYSGSIITLTSSWLAKNRQRADSRLI
jgi:hypothetical protein